MPNFTEVYTLAMERLLGDAAAGPGRHIEYVVESAKLINADRANDTVQVVSADLSAFPITLAPLGVSAPAMLLMLCADYPVDIRTNAATDTQFLSGVQLWAMAGYISNVFITTGSHETTLMLKAAGGSAAPTAIRVAHTLWPCRPSGLSSAPAMSPTTKSVAPSAQVKARPPLEKATAMVPCPMILPLGSSTTKSPALVAVSMMRA